MLVLGLVFWGFLILNPVFQVLIAELMIANMSAVFGFGLGVVLKYRLSLQRRLYAKTTLLG